MVQLVRQLTNQGSIRDLERLRGKVGARARVVRTPNVPTGSQWRIVINRSESAERQRFSLAHEFKHVLDDPFVTAHEPYFDSGHQERHVERICNYFAASLLMPRAWLERDWKADDLGAEIVGEYSVYSLLINDYYVGVVTYRDKKYPGRHEPLVTQEIFDQVQAVLRAHGHSGERDRKHPHYLKGTLYCGGCGRRLTYSENTGNGGTYAYFVCPLRQRKQCEQGCFRADRVEGAVERYYGRVELTETQRDRVHTVVRSHLSDMAATSERESTRCRKVLAELDEQERKLLRAHYEDRVSSQLYDEEQARIRREREQVGHILERLSVEHDQVQATLDLALSVVTNTQRSYETAPPHIRRMLNQALFVRIEVSHGEEVEVRLAEPFVTILDREFFQTVWEEVFASEPRPNTRNGPNPLEGVEPLVVGSINGVEMEVPQQLSNPEVGSSINKHLVQNPV